jgi:uncharacterized protein YjbJ (UPF0337 family)
LTAWIASIQLGRLTLWNAKDGFRRSNIAIDPREPQENDVMDSNRRIEGIGHQVKGAVMESLGIAIGDSKLAADGSAERAIGDKLNSVDAGGEQLAGIDTDRIRGIGHQIRGAVIEAIGNLVGNPQMQSDGVAERNAGKEQNIAGGDRDLAREALERTRSAAEPDENADWRT